MPQNFSVFSYRNRSNFPLAAADSHRRDAELARWKMDKCFQIISKSTKLEISSTCRNCIRDVRKTSWRYKTETAVAAVRKKCDRLILEFEYGAPNGIDSIIWCLFLTATVFRYWNSIGKRRSFHLIFYTVRDGRKLNNLKFQKYSATSFISCPANSAWFLIGNGTQIMPNKVWKLQYKYLKKQREPNWASRERPVKSTRANAEDVLAVRESNKKKNVQNERERAKDRIPCRIWYT